MESQDYAIFSKIIAGKTLYQIGERKNRNQPLCNRNILMYDKMYEKKEEAQKRLSEILERIYINNNEEEKKLAELLKERENREANK